MTKINFDYHYFQYPEEVEASCITVFPLQARIDALDEALIPGHPFYDVIRDEFLRGRWERPDDSRTRWSVLLSKTLHDKGVPSNDVISRLATAVSKAAPVRSSACLHFARTMVERDFDRSWGRQDEGRSCLRDFDYQGSRRWCKQIFKYGGRVVRIYANKKSWLDNPWEGIGRAFIIRQGSFFVAFNLKKPEVQTAHIIANALGLSHVSPVGLDVREHRWLEGRSFILSDHYVGKDVHQLRFRYRKGGRYVEDTHG